MNEHKINLKSRRKISLSNIDNKEKKATSPAEPKYKITIRVPEADQTALVEISVKLANLGYVKKLYDQDKWHIAINVLNKLLDYLDASDISKNEDIIECLEKVIEKQFNK